MKSGARLPLLMLALLALLPFASPYMYTGFRIHGLLYSIDLWVTPTILWLCCALLITCIHALLPETLLLFSRRLRGGVPRRLLITWIGFALFFQLLMVIAHWGNYLDGKPPPEICVLSRMWNVKGMHTQ